MNEERISDTAARKCPQCGAVIPASAPDELCRKCLVREVILQSNPDEDETGRPAGVPAAPAGPLKQIGDYELLEEIGGGGMGVIYRARQEKLNRLVALKMIRQSGRRSPTLEARFRMEAEAVAGLDHPNIVPIYEVGEEDGTLFFAMKLFEGGALASRIPGSGEGTGSASGSSAFASSAHDNQRDLAGLMAAIARAVHHAHQRGVLHRDLKPSNILLDEEGTPYVADFGLARRVEDESDLTLSGAVLGTPAYMSPEQARKKNKELTTATDVYSLGAILYHLLTGRAPFEGESQVDVMRAVVEDEPAPPFKISRGVSRDLGVICLKCLEKEPARRYASAEALAQDLERWASGQTIQARPASALERTVKWTRRRPALAGLIGVTIAAAISVIAILNTSRNRLQAERDYALDQEQKALESETAEREQRGLAEAAQAEADRQVFHLRFLETDQRLREGDLGDAFPRATALLREYPDSSELLTRILTTLVFRNLARPAAKFRHTGGNLSHVEFTPGGEAVLAVASNGYAQLWRAVDGAPVTKAIKHDAPILHASIAPDGETFAVALENGDVIFRNCRDGEKTGLILSHPGPVGRVRFSPDGERLLTLCRKRGVRVWESATGRLISFVPLSSSVGDLRWALGGTRYFTVKTTGVVRLRDAQSGKAVNQADQHTGFNHLAMSPDGKLAATSGALGSVFVWNMETGGLQHRLQHNDFTYVSDFSPDSKRIATGSRDGTVRLWSAITGQPEAPLYYLDQAVRIVKFTPDGQGILIGHDVSTARIFSATENLLLTDNISADRQIRAVDFSSDGTRAVVQFLDADRFRIWDISDKTGAEQFNMATRHWPMQILTDHRNNRVVAVHGSGFNVLQMPDGEEIAKDAIPNGWHIHKGAMNRDGSRFAIGLRNRTVGVYDTEDWKRFSLLPKHPNLIRAVAFIPGTAWLATGCDDFKIRIWDLDSHEETDHELVMPANIAGLEASLDGQTLLAYGDGGHVRAWSLADRSQIVNLKVGTYVHGAAFSPDGERFAFVSNSRVVKVHDTTSGKELRHYEHGERAVCVDWHPDGQRLASGSADGTARIWNIGEETQSGLTLWQGTTVGRLKFSPDGRFLATGDYRNTLRIWDPDTGLPLVEPIVHPAGVYSIGFSSGSETVVTGTISDRMYGWPLRRVELEETVPDWFIELLESAVGFRMDSKGVMRRMTFQEVESTRNTATERAGKDTLGRWARWLLTPPQERGTPPM